ncbi:MAG: M48 family metallopeptidase [Tenericutes bacterium]|nr:M48 family metallopeptidase [Mycoplasmatota bacterium]
MHVVVNGKLFNLYIEKKNNKNMYLRVKKDGIYITSNYLISNKTILEFIEKNASSIIEMDKKVQKKEKKKEEFYYLGKKYDVVKLNTINKIEFVGDRVFVKNVSYLNTFLENEAKRIFNERVDVCFNLFEENIPYPEVAIRKMKRKWGYCNKKEKLIKLNFELIKYSINEIDYVIIHELCHFLEFNHSTNFWKYVKKYKSDYKSSQKILKEE